MSNGEPIKKDFRLSADLGTFLSTPRGIDVSEYNKSVQLDAATAKASQKYRSETSFPVEIEVNIWQIEGEVNARNTIKNGLESRLKNIISADELEPLAFVIADHYAAAGRRRVTRAWLDALADTVRITWGAARHSEGGLGPANAPSATLMFNDVAPTSAALDAPPLRDIETLSSSEIAQRPKPLTQEGILRGIAKASTKPIVSPTGYYFDHEREYQSAEAFLRHAYRDRLGPGGDLNQSSLRRLDSYLMDALKCEFSGKRMLELRKLVPTLGDYNNALLMDVLGYIPTDPAERHSALIVMKRGERPGIRKSGPRWKM